MSVLNDPVSVGLAAGFMADRLLGDPRRFHPVAGFGRLAGRAERLLYADNRPAGVVFTTVMVTVPGITGWTLDRALRHRPAWRTVVVAVGTWSVLGGRSLAREAASVADHLARADLTAAREQVTHLVGRDPSSLDAEGIARATVESVAENTSDAVVAPLLAGAVLGLPGLVGYRAANTLDAMVGHRSPRYTRFGWASARFDDLANLAPARLAGLCAVLGAPVVKGSQRDALRAWRDDAWAHPSPNAGVVEAAFAGALGRTLGGVNVYAGTTEHRAELGAGPTPDTADIARATRLAAVVDWAALGVVLAGRWVVQRAWQRSP